MKPYNIMFTLALASGIGLAAANLLTGERLSILLLGLVPPVMATAMGLLIRYVTKTAQVTVAKTN